MLFLYTITVAKIAIVILIIPPVPTNKPILAAGKQDNIPPKNNLKSKDEDSFSLSRL